MKTTILFFIIMSFFPTCFSSIIHAEKGTVILEKGIRLQLFKSNFDSSMHKIERCEFLNWTGVCLIDNNLVYGTDWELPIAKLDSAIVEIGNNEIPLDVSCMYNPWFGQINSDAFQIERSEGGYILNGLFSDGAGTYIAQWKIISNSSLRTIISNNENLIVRIFYK